MKPRNLYRGGKTMVTWETFRDGTVKIVFAEPIKVPLKLWNRRVIHVFTTMPLPSRKRPWPVRKK